MNIKVKATVDGKVFKGEIDLDGDIHSKERIIDQSVRIKSQEDGTIYYFTEQYDLFTNCKTVKIEKYVE
jgi:hypothetical protein